MGIAKAGAGTRPYSPPAPITDDHKRDGFDCGKSSLDQWLRAHALENEDKASRTYVVTAQSGEVAGQVVAYYTLANGSGVRTEVPKKIRQGLPNPVPVMVLGRLAGDARRRRNGLGPFLLREAMQRTVQASQIAGLRALIVHAIDDEAVNFYAKYGFQVFPAGTRTMFLPIETLEQAIGS